MNWQLIGNAAFRGVEFALAQGESILTETGSMAWHQGNVTVSSNMKGGVFSSLKRAVLQGESFFQNTWTGGEGGGHITLVSGSPGEIIPIDITPQIPLHLERGAYLANTGHVTTNAKWEGFGGLLKEGLFAIRAEGQGTLFFSSYGGIDIVQVNGSYIVDNGYAVAWDSTLTHHLTRTGKKIRSFLFGDQLITRFDGVGRLWIQNRNPQSLASFLHPFRRVKSNN